jgi:4-hydroxy-tetrahydrodipicolinate reductase
MTLRRYRVVQWATGSVGASALRAIVEHPDLELVGVLVFDPAKEGLDAGALCGIGETGVRATRDLDAVLALDPDCVSHCPRNTRETTDEVAAVLEHGINVVSTALLPALYPHARHVSPRSTQRLTAACATGGSSLFVSGIDPGFATDALPILMTSICGRVDRIRMMEIMSYEHYDDADTQFRWFGFGAPMDSEVPPYLAPGRLTRYWGPTVELVAAGIGVELDEIREETERLATPSAVEVDAGRIEAGTVGALRFAVQGFHDGRELVTLEHITRLHPALAPEWPQPMVPDGVYRIIIEGWPSYELNLFGTDEHGKNYPALEAATAFRVVNRIPDVCDAPAGILTPFDFGLVRNPGLYRPASSPGATAD